MTRHRFGPHSIWLTFLVMPGFLGCGEQLAPSRPVENPGPTEATAADTTPAVCVTDDDRPSGTLTVEAEGLTREEKEALAAGFEQLLSDAVHEGINKAIADMLEKLELTGEMELGLFAVLPTVGEVGQDEGTISIYLIKPGNISDGPRTIVLTRDDEPCFRLTRAAGPVERPVAIITFTGVADGQPAISEWVAVYDNNGEWTRQKSEKRTESLDE